MFFCFCMFGFKDKGWMRGFGFKVKSLLWGFGFKVKDLGLRVRDGMWGFSGFNGNR